MYHLLRPAINPKKLKRTGTRSKNHPEPRLKGISTKYLQPLILSAPRRKLTVQKIVLPYVVAITDIIHCHNPLVGFSYTSP